MSVARPWLPYATASLLALAVSSSCRPEDGARPPAHAGAWITPPPLPGASITHTVMCSCLTCSPRSCCGGTTSENESSCIESDGGVACGGALLSCTPRCTDLVWRVADTAPCDSRRPSACCAE